MTHIAYGDVVLVPYPFTDMNLYKPRPGVVVSGAKYNSQTHHVWIVMITRAQKSSWPSDIIIQDHKQAGILNHSKIRFKIACLDQKLINRKLGTLGQADLDNLEKGLKSVMHEQ